MKRRRHGILIYLKNSDKNDQYLPLIALCVLMQTRNNFSFCFAYKMMLVNFAKVKF
jgi:hypothetical protein